MIHKDKILHFTVWGLMTFIMALFLNDRVALWSGLTTAILKEIFDRLDNKRQRRLGKPIRHTSDGLDFISGMCGVCFGVLMSEGL